MQQPIYLDANKKKFVRLIKSVISPEIPNIYSYGDFNNTSLRISQDKGVTWDTVTLQTGVYSIAAINDAIVNVSNQLNYWKTPAAPGFELNYSNSTSYAYVYIDSSQLTAGGNFYIDFSVSQIWQLLGFTSTTIIQVEGFTQAPNLPLVDAQGNIVDISVSILQGIKYINGVPSNVLVTVPIQTPTAGNEIVYPFSGIPSPIIEVTIPQYISSFTVNFLNSEGKPIIWSQGNVLLEFEIIQ
jgi:hypothetical protein